MKDCVLQFKRRYYRDRKTGEGGFYPVDDYFGIERYARIAIDVKQMIYEFYTTMKITKIAQFSRVSKMTVYNILNRLGKKDLMYRIEPNESITQVFIQADEKHLSINGNKRDREARLIMVYTGRKKECNNRYKLVNKKYFLFTEQDDHTLKWEEVYDYIDKQYPKCKTFYLGADGGSWIMKGREVFPQAHYIYDKFHFVQSLTRIFGSSIEGKRKQYEAYCCVKSGDKKSFRTLAERWIKVADDNHFGNIKNRKAEKCKVMRNFASIRNNWNLKNYGGTSAEGHISHYLAANFASRPKAFSTKRFPNYLKLLEYKLNGIDFETYQKAKRRTIVTKFELEGDSYTDMSYRCNVPALQSSNTKLRRELRGIIA
jgi:hypothetical protein